MFRTKHILPILLLVTVTWSTFSCQPSEKGGATGSKESPDPALLPPTDMKSTAMNEVDLPDSGRAACREILIRYKDAVGADPSIQRSQAEAKALAADVLAQLKGGASFDSLVKKFSEGRSADRAGYIAPFPRGGRPKAIEDAVFALSVGQLSDVVESSAGYHVFLREEGVNYRAYFLLVSWKEAGKNPRTRQQAERLMDELYGRIVAHPDSFADIARHYTDGPRKNFGGNLGTFNRYTHGTEVGDVASRLTPGHLSRIFETPEGLAVMLRLE